MVTVVYLLSQSPVFMLVLVLLVTLKTSRSRGWGSGQQERTRLRRETLWGIRWEEGSSMNMLREQTFVWLYDICTECGFAEADEATSLYRTTLLVVHS